MSKDRSSKISKNVKHYRLMLVGVTPLLMSNDLPISLLTGTKPEISKDRSLKDICEANLYLDDDDNITMPAAKILAALSIAGKFFKYDGKPLSTYTTSLIPSFLRIIGEFTTFKHEGWKPDQCWGTLPSGATAAITRTRFNDWSVAFEIELNDNEPIKIETVIKLFQKTGKVPGLGSSIPGKGQFRVESCVEIELDKSA